MTILERKMLNHFVDLAKAGAHPNASAGEYKARQLALAIAEHITGLDDSTMIGMRLFALTAQKSNDTARTMIEGWGDK